MVSDLTAVHIRTRRQLSALATSFRRSLSNEMTGRLDAALAEAEGSTWRWQCAPSLPADRYGVRRLELPQVGLPAA